MHSTPHLLYLVQSEQATCTVMDVIDKAMPNIIKRYLATLSFKERVRKICMEGKSEGGLVEGLTFPLSESLCCHCVEFRITV